MKQQTVTVTLSETDAPRPSVVGVYDLSDLVLASLASTAAPALETVEVAPLVETPGPAAQAAAAPVVVKPPSTSEMVAYVDVPDCIACHACEDACPTKSITVMDFSQIDPNICEACNECVGVCPTSCISLQPRASYYELEFAIKK